MMRSNVRMTLIVIITAVVIGIVATIIRARTFAHAPLDPQGETKEVIIPERTSFRAVSQRLKDQKFIRSAPLFSLYLVVTRSYHALQPGVYALSAKMTPEEIRLYLVEGRTSQYRVTLIEGWAVRDMTTEFEKKGIITADQFTLAAEGKEGYLFPDTYQFRHGVTAQEIVQKLADNFTRRTEALNPTADQVILASIVEREAKRDEDRAKIAGVYLNRLKKGMRLEADPTVQYAKGSWAPITTSDYRSVDSPYNTYLHDGLPPGSICNPSLKSIEAAVHPTQTDALYFFHLKDGQTIYSKTLEEHNQNKKRYQNER